MLDQIPTEVPNHSKAPTDGVSSSDVLGALGVPAGGALSGPPENKGND